MDGKVAREWEGLRDVLSMSHSPSRGEIVAFSV